MSGQVLTEMFVSGRLHNFLKVCDLSLVLLDFSIWGVGGWVRTATTDGITTSTTLSASCASSSRLVVSGVAASAIQTLAGRRWRNNSRRNELSVELALSPRSCCIRRKNCVCLQSPNSSALKSCCRRRCSEAAVHLISCALRVSYGFSVGGVISALGLWSRFWVIMRQRHGQI